MITVTTPLELDLSCTAPRARINAKQGDGGTRQIVARFTNGTGIISDLGTVAGAEIKVLRPDGVTVKTAATIADGAVTATLTAGMLAVAGRAFGDIVLSGDSGSISAARFDLNIMAAADSGIAPDPTPHSGGGAPAVAAAVAAGVVGAVGAASVSYDIDIDLIGQTWEQGTYYVNDGSTGDMTTGIRMVSYLDISKISNFLNREFTITASAGNAEMQYSFIFYDNIKNFIKSSTALGWKNNGTLSQCGTSAVPAFVRVILNADSNITPDMLSSARFMIV